MNDVVSQAVADEDIGDRIFLCTACVISSWNWLREHTNPRPNAPVGDCILHDDVWINDCDLLLNNPSPQTSMMLARLFVVSQLGDLATIIDIVSGQENTGAIVLPAIDPSTVNLINNESRFRAALSEHLSFWIRLAVISKRPDVNEFSTSRPNYIPEDSGPDGISFVISDQSTEVEVSSVKSSINNPRQNISSPSFRRGDEPDESKLLDGFYVFDTTKIWLVRLDRMLDDALARANLTVEQQIRMSLLGESDINAVVVADEQWNNAELFVAYNRIRNSPTQRIATYIGSHNWERLSEATRQWVLRTLL